MKTVLLNGTGVGRYGDSSPFPIADLDIQIIGIPNSNGEFRFISEMNGERCVVKAVTPSDNSVSIPLDKLEAGRFTAVVNHYYGGKIVRQYRIEDLLISDEYNALIADPQIAELERKVARLGNEVCVLKEDNQTLKATVSDLEKRLEILESNNDIFAN